MYSLPTEIKVNNTPLTIRGKGDYRVIIDCITAFQNEELKPEERNVAGLFIFLEKFDTIEDMLQYFTTKEMIEEAMNQLFIFLNCGEEEIGYDSNTKLIDWEQDEKLITSAINKVAGKEIRLEPYIHWWTFVSYYLGIGDSPLATVVGIRNKIKKGKKLEKWEKDFKKENPSYFIWKKDLERKKKDDDYVRSLWNQT